MKLTIQKLKCTRCKHTWVLRKTELPKTCPNCRSPYWNKPRKIKVTK